MIKGYKFPISKCSRPTKCQCNTRLQLDIAIKVQVILGAMMLQITVLYNCRKIVLRAISHEWHAPFPSFDRYTHIQCSSLTDGANIQK